MILKSFITTINSWSDFKSNLDHRSKLEKGRAFEELTKLFLQIDPVYQSKLKHVWLREEVPATVNKKLNLPNTDQGIDLIAETFDGSFWAIQCKYLQEEEQRLSHRAISTFISLSTGIAENISHCVVCTTVDDYAKIYHGKKNISFINSDTWRKLNQEFFENIRTIEEGKKIKSIPFKPKPHQERAIKEAKNYFIKQKNERGKLVFPCGAGKSLTGYWITRELKPKSVLVAVPSLSLVKQTLEVYLRESVANKEKIAWLCVCSDEGIGKNDDVAIHTSDMGVPCITDKDYIANWLKKNKSSKTIIFTTYQSGKVIAEASTSAKHVFDLGIMDEAHKTVGDKEKLFSHLLFDRNIKIRKRIFMTATERRYAGSSETVLSMDDAKMYGDTFTQMSFKEAIDIGILSDYKIITLFISNEEVRKLIEENAFVKPEGKEWDKETEARTLASLIALRKAMKEYPIHHAVTFHSSIKKAEAFDKSQDVFSSVYPQFGKVRSFHVSGAMNTSYRGKIVDEFAEAENAIITNAKCLTEGVDVPNIDCVLFADPRKSTVDIVQAVGRALRKKEGKEFGYVILPVFTDSKTSEEIIESEEFKEILTTIRALASNDERIIEYFREISKGIRKSKNDALIHFDLDIPLTEKINEKELINSIELKAWNKLAKLSWMPFEEAREFVRKLGLKNRDEFSEYHTNGKLPSDIPYHPEREYKNSGWLGTGDWLGTNTIAAHLREYRTFEDARNFVRALKLKSRTDWDKYCLTGAKPVDIPVAIDAVYKEKWISLGDFLGTNILQTQLREYLSLEEAKRVVRSYGIKSMTEWREFCRKGLKPDNVPYALHYVYKEKGWTTYGDFFGTGRISDNKKVFLSFNEAKKYLKQLDFKSVDEWNDLVKSNKKPSNIPSQPAIKYKKEWKGLLDFLGLQKKTRKLEFMSYEDAKNLTNKLNIKSSSEWNKHWKLNARPSNLPAAPYLEYKNRGWISWEKFLDNNLQKRLEDKFMPFNEARDYVRKLNIKTTTEWKIYSKSIERPRNIHSKPNKFYSKEWKGWSDFLGNK